jgi:hypothetical protein
MVLTKSLVVLLSHIYRTVGRRVVTGQPFEGIHGTPCYTLVEVGIPVAGDLD